MKIAPLKKKLAGSRHSISRRLYSRMLVAVAITFSCASGPEWKPAPVEDLYCEGDADCELVMSPLIREKCCGRCPEPYAISRVAADRHRANMASKCGEEVACTDEAYRCCNTKFTDWTAVCSHHACERRSTKFFGAPERTCGIGSLGAAPPNMALNATVGRGRPPAR